jgi:heme/copper-type cytochrome/quinol oxidase subunit 4
MGWDLILVIILALIQLWVQLDIFSAFGPRSQAALEFYRIFISTVSLIRHCDRFLVDYE